MDTQSKIKHLFEKFEEKRGKIDLSLERIIWFLEKIGSPQLRIPPVIHFAGTNGKGSTIAFLKAMLEADGKTCHVYTSPHLVKFNERITICGKHIDDALLLEVLEQVDAHNQKYKSQIELTFFELTTIAAFIAFSKVKADYVLLETGMGGRFDATNVITPVLSIITPISFDHMEFLGNTLAKIAFEKAGIIKPAVPVISAAQVKEVEEVLKKVAADNNSQISFAPVLENIELGLAGEHQKINAGVAAEAAWFLRLSEAAISKGLKNAMWPARLQKITTGKLRSLLPQDFALYLDGAHNEAGAEALAAEIPENSALVLGMLQTKDPQTYLSKFTYKNPLVYTISISSVANGFPPTELALIAKNLGFSAIPCNDAADALKAAAADETRKTVYICGSLYLAGEILELNIYE